MKSSGASDGTDVTQPVAFSVLIVVSGNTGIGSLINGDYTKQFKKS